MPVDSSGKLSRMDRHMRRIRVAIAAGVGICIFAGLARYSVMKKPRVSSTTAGRHAPSWVMPMSRLTVLTDAVHSLHVDQSKAEVIRILGQPDNDVVLSPKLSTETPHGTEIVYYTVRYETGFSNAVYDRVIVLKFDNAGLLKSIGGDPPCSVINGFATKPTTNMSQRGF